MKTRISLILISLLASCSNHASENTTSESAVTTIDRTDTVPLTYDDLKTRFSDSISPVPENRIKDIYSEICGKQKSNRHLDYSALLAEDLLPAYERLEEISKAYKDSSAAFLEVLEMQLTGLEKQTEKLETLKPLETALKLKISETKSDIFGHLSDLRMKKIKHD